MQASRGQSLIETLVALSVMVIGIAGAVSLGIISIRAGQTSQLDVVAENLAREGIEAARSVRDANWREGQAWNAGLADGSYRVIVGIADDPADQPITLEPVDDTQPLSGFNYKICLTPIGQYLSPTNLTTPDAECSSQNPAWENTAFHRRVTVKEISAVQIQITCEVLRSGGVGSVTYTVAEDLYDWHE